MGERTVAGHGLRPLGREELIGKAHRHAVFAFARGAEAEPRGGCRSGGDAHRGELGPPC
ncbi:hypothetical protein [Streptomyces sp. FH025]|uniref:hypothetical protein n=1 Tax=Streptomyces sp. FH025 TaxID=2815937 RepID=UPI001A9F01F9|nr:hypothetical protein [Streptomyces sp. FH025]MBO1420333.1 hypothetical protein [Streptomyces sp. FH025]